MEKMMHLAKGLDEKVFFKIKHDATDIEDEDDEEVNLPELDPMEDSTKAEEYIDNLFQDDDPSTVMENRVETSNISGGPLFLGGKGRIIGVRIH